MVAFLRLLGWVAIVTGGGLCAIGALAMLIDEKVRATASSFVFFGALSILWGYSLARNKSRDGPGMSEPGDPSQWVERQEW